MLKDLDLVLRLAEVAGARLPGARTVRDVYAAADRAGRGDEDFSAVIEEVARGAD
jgi:3-hydroxyisobutyrate dehydrogenase-like beta-hydroxyacid dehydrogenase